MEYIQVEKFQTSPYFTASTLSHNGTEKGTHKSNKPTAVLRKTSRQLETHSIKRDRPSKISDDENVALGVYPDGREVNAALTAALTAAKSLLIENFTININCHESDADTPIKYCVPSPPPEPSLTAVYTTHGYPLHVALEGSPCVKANLSLTTIFFSENIHLVTLYSNGQGAHYLSANNYNYYVAIDSDNNIQALPAAEIDNVNDEVYTLRRENVTNYRARYYFEIGGNKHYLKATSNGHLTTQQTACDQCIFTHLYG